MWESTLKEPMCSAPELTKTKAAIFLFYIDGCHSTNKISVMSCLYGKTTQLEIFQVPDNLIYGNVPSQIPLPLDSGHPNLPVKPILKKDSAYKVRFS